MIWVERGLGFKVYKKKLKAQGSKLKAEQEI